MTEFISLFELKLIKMPLFKRQYFEIKQIYEYSVLKMNVNNIEQISLIEKYIGYSIQKVIQDGA